ncbi:hypothetical protein [Altererythrobacter sp. Z27]|uniref:hypothetical protein n=1 Tax=Altererythrobacter sp. Z27 TaxID=3461147 RepID=UPI004043AA65
MRGAFCIPESISMKSPILFALYPVALALTLPAHAAGTPQTESTEQAVPPEAKEEKKICKRDEGRTGSRLGGKKICKTKAEWEQSAREARDSDRFAS